MQDAPCSRHAAGTASDTPSTSSAPEVRDVDPARHPARSKRSLSGHAEAPASHRRRKESPRRSSLPRRSLTPLPEETGDDAPMPAEVPLPAETPSSSQAPPPPPHIEPIALSSAESTPAVFSPAVSPSALTIVIDADTPSSPAAFTAAAPDGAASSTPALLRETATLRPRVSFDLSATADISRSTLDQSADHASTLLREMSAYMADRFNQLAGAHSASFNEFQQQLSAVTDTNAVLRDDLATAVTLRGRAEARVVTLEAQLAEASRLNAELTERLAQLPPRPTVHQTTQSDTLVLAEPITATCADASVMAILASSDATTCTDPVTVAVVPLLDTAVQTDALAESSTTAPAPHPTNLRPGPAVYMAIRSADPAEPVTHWMDDVSSTLHVGHLYHALQRANALPRL